MSGLLRLGPPRAEGREWGWGPGRRGKGGRARAGKLSVAVVAGLGFGAPPAGQPRDAAPFLPCALRIRWSASLVDRAAQAVFSFLYFLKIKISKIYVRFEIFQKYTPVALP